ncbi:T9SS type A sorting domain-containing protein [Lutibacter sp.]|uniref:T9SS type A sorting domain-containing protein n=1 Tax=Lutibacter sp. TaxID=1925666 RepID=UPI0025C50FE8|nr:T9SS type A sorting domain-containing protein [Lutibacter sp.]MCF6182372.1 T9SS type A sorting domain-containing protein [Lutibacter sp.]
MLKQLLLFLIVFTIIQQINSQNTSSEHLVRSTTGVAGSSENILINNKEYVIQQSIGQTSAIGTYENNKYTLRQGFIQPNVLAKIIDKLIPLDLKVIVYPNPFVENISLSFTEEIKDDIRVSVYDLLGRLLFVNSYKANKHINITLKDLSVAKYILKVKANNRQFIKTIIKK